MHKIFKYQLAVLEKQVIQLPLGAKIIRVDDVEGKFYLWAIVDVLEKQLEDRYICAYKTGMEIDRDVGDLEYLGFVKMFVMQELALYLHEDVSKRKIVCDTENYQ